MGMVSHCLFRYIVNSNPLRSTFVSSSSRYDLLNKTNELIFLSCSFEAR